MAGEGGDMSDRFFPHPALRHRLRAGPLGEHIDAYAERLQERGYAGEAAREHLRLVAHLSWWLGEHRFRVDDLDEQRTVQFLEHRRRRGFTPRSNAGALTAL